MIQPHRFEDQAAFVLHTYPFKETSLIVELFSRDHGRMPVMAKGARRPRSALRGMLQSFQPMRADWTGKGEVKTLVGLEWDAGMNFLHGEALMCGFYMNELLLRLLPREDAHEELFDEYRLTLRTLGADKDHASILRRFELKLLQTLGYALPLLQDVSGQAIHAEQTYRYSADSGAQPHPAENETASGAGILVTGASLLAMAQDDFTDVRTQQQSKQLMRYLLGYHLGEKPLYTRQLLIDLQDL